MYESSEEEDLNPADLELLPHERVSEVWRQEFQRYFDRWIRYWPKSSKTGFFHKLAYDTPFFQPKSKKDPAKPRHLWGDYLIDVVERHLDGDHWAVRKQAQTIFTVKQTEYWLGLTMPKKTTVSCIDLDAKQYLLGYYRVFEKSPLRPVVHLPLEHFRKLKLVYDNFPGRVWCISSATLGLHIWQKLARPVPSVAIHARTKAELARLGLGAVEVHPMPGRCLRRPFGPDYATISVEGLLTTWQDQVRFFEFVAETPPFEVIARALLAAVRAQWGAWCRSGDANRGRAYKQVDAKKVIAEHQHHLDGVERWIEAGCPVAGGPSVDVGQQRIARWVDAGCPPRSEPLPDNNPGRGDGLDQWIDSGCPSGECPIVFQPCKETGGRNCGHLGFPRPRGSQTTNADVTGQQHEFDLASLRAGHWVKGLRDIAINGLPCDKSLHAVCYEMAKWLYWVELYKQPECEQVIYNLLLQFVRTKHNGHSQRIVQGDWASVEKDLQNVITSAKKLDHDYRSKSLALFMRLRQKRDMGGYKHVINVAPHLTDQETHNTSLLPSSCLLICISSLETPLPVELRAMIEAKAGRNKVMSFATRLINLLYQQGGGCRLHQDKLMELLGYRNPTQATKYRDILTSSKVLKKGHYYRQGKASRLYTLSKEVMDLLASARMERCVVA